MQKLFLQMQKLLTEKKCSQMQKLLKFFSAKILAYTPYLMIKVLTIN